MNARREFGAGGSKFPAWAIAAVLLVIAAVAIVIGLLIWAPWDSYSSSSGGPGYAPTQQNKPY